MSEHRAVILTTNQLEAIGLRELLRNVFDIDAYIGDKFFFKSLNVNNEPSFFFIDQSTFVGNLSFFLPRKAKTIVLNKEDIDEMNTLQPSASENELIDMLSRLLRTGKKEENTSTALSSREIEVLRLIASGHINKEIAQELNISINTVLTHRKNLTAKLGIKSVSGLSFYAMMNGIV